MLSLRLLYLIHYHYHHVHFTTIFPHIYSKYKPSSVSFVFISVPRTISLKFQIHRGRLAIFPPGHNLIKPAHELKRCNSVTRNTQKCKCLNALTNFFSFVTRTTYPTGQPANVKYIFQFPHTSVLFIFHLYDHYITL